MRISKQVFNTIAIIGKFILNTDATAFTENTAIVFQVCWMVQFCSGSNKVTSKNFRSSKNRQKYEKQFSDQILKYEDCWAGTVKSMPICSNLTTNIVKIKKKTKSAASAIRLK